MEKFSEGSEHEVFLSRQPRWLIKRPKKITQYILRTTGYDVSKVRRELQEAIDASAETSIVKIPKTRIFNTKKLFGLNRSGYIIVQQRLIPDGSIPNVKKELEDLGNDYFLDVYNSTKDPSRGNFISSEGNLYFVDPFHSYHRFFERFFCISFRGMLRLKKTAFTKIDSFKGEDSEGCVQLENLSRNW